MRTAENSEKNRPNIYDTHKTMYATEKKQSEVSGLPPGWKIERITRKSGLSAGHTDVYYISPDGVKLRSKAQLVRVLGAGFDTSCLDFGNRT